MSSFESVALSAPARIRPVGGFGKRLCDVVIAVAAAILLSPVVVLVALLVRICLGGPVLFVHRRVGFNGQEFTCFKFRTMVQDAQAVLERHLAQNPEAAAEWAATRKLKSDPRVTRFGRFLRASSLDELPQLLNILRGDMSCVGPRPVPRDELLQNYGPFAFDYIRARPGLTGVWQVSGRNDVTYAERVAMDKHYVQNWSAWTDFVIMVRTVPATLARRGSF